jgi:hypothetical protein
MSPISSEQTNLYYLLVFLTMLASIPVICQLMAYANQMAQFQFQPDLQLRDQFIKLHTLMIKGINKNVSVYEA